MSSEVSEPPDEGGRARAVRVLVLVTLALGLARWLLPCASGPAEGAGFPRGAVPCSVERASGVRP